MLCFVTLRAKASSNKKAHRDHLWTLQSCYSIIANSFIKSSKSFEYL